ncbi:MAG: enoyl-CoA hydratase [Nevskia sp.]|nr:enoyl-CoA hydratase [Nevskia sp.]
MSDKVLVSAADGVLEIRFNRADKKNALTDDMYAAVVEALQRADREPALRVVLISGEGAAFSAGNDLQDFMQNPPDLSGGAQAGPVWRFMQILSTLRKVVVAAVQGPAVGVGSTLLLHCDLVVAADTARFSLPFINLGLVPEFGSTLLLPRLMGHQLAAEITLLGEPFDAATAQRLGLVNRVVPEAALRDTARELARKLAAKAPEALLLTKQLLRNPQGTLSERIAEEAGLFSKRLRSAEFREAASAFFEKRAPDFSKL